jgi:hypothetical protein
MMDSVPADSRSRSKYSGSVAAATHTPAESALRREKRLDHHKKNPGNRRSRGACRLSPQPVGSFDSGGVSRRDRATPHWASESLPVSCCSRPLGIAITQCSCGRAVAGGRHACQATARRAAASSHATLAAALTLQGWRPSSAVQRPSHVTKASLPRRPDSCSFAGGTRSTFARSGCWGDGNTRVFLSQIREALRLSAGGCERGASLSFAVTVAVTWFDCACPREHAWEIV